MRTRSQLTLAVAAAALAAACGKDSCPSTAANAENQNMGTAGVCTAPAAQQVAIKLNLCEACSHTDPTCSPDLHAAGSGGANSGDIFLDTKWEVCTDKSSCSAQACAFVTCQFSVPSGTYQVQTIGKQGSTVSFTLDTMTGGPLCTGSI